MHIYQCRSVYQNIQVWKNSLYFFEKYAFPLWITNTKRNLTTSVEQVQKLEEKTKEKKVNKKKLKSNFPGDGPDFNYFIDKWKSNTTNIDLKKLTRMDYKYLSHPYINIDDLNGNGRKVFFKVYGCQMNVSDADIAWGILKHHGYEMVHIEKDADVILIVTCSIREKAEEKIWTELKNLAALKKHSLYSKKVGILGCMAERLRYKIIEKQNVVDLVCGPDSYKDLPRLLAITYEGDKAINVMLSHDETYADVTPVMVSPNKVSAFVSIMRGCDNMCTYCIVPFTRGKERSRDANSIIKEIKQLYDSGIKQVTLLGQNVNSYNDVSIIDNYSQPVKVAKGFSTIYKPKEAGLRFADLLDKVSLIGDELRIRFISPHPKDFPDEVLQIMKERNNICKCIHLPIQSGNTRILEMMRRGYTRESYLELVSHIRNIIPNVNLTTDIICGFCSETENEFQDTMSVVEQVGYSFIYGFHYSLREKTTAHRKYIDDVPRNVKLDRLNRLFSFYKPRSLEHNLNMKGKREIILVTGHSSRSQEQFEGRCDGNIKVIIPYEKLNIVSTEEHRYPKPGDYILVEVTDGNAQTLMANPICITTMTEHYRSLI